MIIHDKKNFVAGALYVSFGALVAIGSASYDLGTAQRMGPGYFPLALGLLLMGVGLLVAASALGAAGPRTELGHWPMGTVAVVRSEEHTSELQSLMRISSAVLCLE